MRQIHKNYSSNYASHGKFHRNEFFKHVYDISKLRPAQTHFLRTQMNSTQPIHAVSTHIYAPKVAQVIKTQGPSRITLSYEKGRFTVPPCLEYAAN